MSAGGPALASVPRATYRLQFSRSFRILDGIAVLPYLAELGISHVYASPLLKARSGSTHGYDVTDYNLLNPELGSAADYERFFAELERLDLGLLLDFVPNHMGIGAGENLWWLDLLEEGQASIHAGYFDVDWHPRQPRLQNRVLLPILGDHYGRALEKGEIKLRFDAASGSFNVWYYRHRLPLRPRHYAAVIRRGLARQGAGLPGRLHRRLEDLAADFDRLRRPQRTRRAASHAAAAAAKARLAALAEQPAARSFLEAAARDFDGAPGQPASFRPLHALLEQQHYRLAFWRVAADEINYRRFFNINDLVGVRMEERALFDEAHRLIGRLIGEGRLQGLRLDHVDGLYDPAEYFARLQALATEASGSALHILVEKILARPESLRREWPVAGTTGYELIDFVTRLFVQPRAERRLTRVYETFIGGRADFDAILEESKDRVIDDELASELNLLAYRLDRISEQHWSTRDYTLERLHAALKAVVLQFPIYRTYVDRKGATAEDRRAIDGAVARAKRRWRGPDAEVLDFVRSILTAEAIAEPEGPYRPADVLRFAMKFQQYTGPVMAKAAEDTAFYRYHRLVALNEVGGDPRNFSLSAGGFHRAVARRFLPHPAGLLTTATHDTKRGEDARLRIAAISELASDWRAAVERWRRFNRPGSGGAGAETAPAPEDEYLIYQALVGFWPAALDGVALPPESRRRFRDFLLKALREAKQHTSWDNPNEEYENGCTAFLERMLDPERARLFLRDFSRFAARAAFHGMLSSLGQTVLKLTLPGVPDIYQGTEFWDESLVDPDNRRPVDFRLRRRRLAALGGGRDAVGAKALAELAANWRDGRIKLYLAARLLQLRRETPRLYQIGRYNALFASGARKENVLAFARRREGQCILVIVGRLLAGLMPPNARSCCDAAWEDTAIRLSPGMEGTWLDVFSGRKVKASRTGATARIAAEDALSLLPVAVLSR